VKHEGNNNRIVDINSNVVGDHIIGVMGVEMNIDREIEENYGDCPEHGNVKAKWEDHGIGVYEYWGAKGVDTQWVAVCSECDEVLENVE